MDSSSPFVGSWVVEVASGDEPPSADLNPLFAAGMATCMADGTFVGAASPAYPSPEQGPGDRLYVGGVHGFWQPIADDTASVIFEVLLRNDLGRVVGNVSVAATVKHDPDTDALTGSYGTNVGILSRGWTGNPVIPDGQLRAHRIRDTRPG
jgi:hypothetical protein